MGAEVVKRSSTRRGLAFKNVTGEAAGQTKILKIILHGNQEDI